MSINAYPLAWPEGWPRAKVRKTAKFSRGVRQYSQHGSGSWVSHDKLTIADAVARVQRELGALDVPRGESVISTNLELRLDGLPKSGQREPDDAGVAVYWRRGRGEMKVMAIDIYDRVADNIAAVAATLEAMRAIERHGGAQILDRAFTGFTALPPPRSHWDVLGIAPRSNADAINAAYRAKALAAHPDKGGSTAAMAELNAARDAALKEIS